MEHTLNQLRALRLKGMRQKPSRGKMPDVRLPNTSDIWTEFVVLGGFSIIGFVLSVIFSGQTQHVIGRAVEHGLITGVAAMAVYCLLPLLTAAGNVLLRGRLISRDSLKKFNWRQKLICLLFIAACILVAFNYIFPSVFHINDYPKLHGKLYLLALPPYLRLCLHLLITALVLAAVLAFIVPDLLPAGPLPETAKAQTKSGFGLWLGRSTGKLAKLWHAAGLAPNIQVALSLEDAAQNILVMGGIGSGKTTRLMPPLLAQLFDQECGGLLFDIKGDVKTTAVQLAEMANRPLSIIGPGHQSMNLLAGLSPEIAASFLKSAFLLGGKYHEAFWTDTATELCRNVLGALSFLPEHYSLQGLYQYLFDTAEQRLEFDEKLTAVSAALDAKNAELLNNYWRYQDSVFDKFDEKTKAGVMATVAQILSPFNHPDMIGAFCRHSQNNQSMEAVLDGTVYLVNLPLSRWGLGGKVAYTFIKLRFFNVMQSRNQQPNLNQDRPVFFMCDEYQELISANKDGLSDLNFWDKSRSSKTIGIISAQSVSSFYAAIGDRDLANALLQNFRQKFCFRTEDQATLTMMDSLAGRAKVLRKTSGATSGNSSGGASNSSSSHRSTSHSIVETREAVLDATIFRNLSPNQAIALLSLEGHSMDDVLEMMPLYVN